MWLGVTPGILTKKTRSERDCTTCSKCDEEFADDFAGSDFTDGDILRWEVIFVYLPFRLRGPYMGN